MKRIITCMLVFLTCLLPGLSFGAEGKCTKGDCDTGKGVMEYPNGEQYSGEFQEGIMQGKGTYPKPQIKNVKLKPKCYKTLCYVMM